MANRQKTQISRKATLLLSVIHRMKNRMNGRAIMVMLPHLIIALLF